MDVYRTTRTYKPLRGKSTQYNSTFTDKFVKIGCFQQSVFMAWISLKDVHVSLLPLKDLPQFHSYLETTPVLSKKNKFQEIVWKFQEIKKNNTTKTLSSNQAQQTYVELKIGSILFKTSPRSFSDLFFKIFADPQTFHLSLVFDFINWHSKLRSKEKLLLLIK